MVIMFIQARMGSTRLPGKVLRPIAGRPMLWHLWWRLSHAETLDNVVVATADSASSDPIEEFCRQNDIPCFRGPEDRVLDRIYQAAVAFKADTIAAVCGDSPLIDPRITDKVVREYQKYRPDLCSISPSFTYPNGFGTVVFPMEVLEQAYKEAKSDIEREHLTVYIQRNPDKFKIRFVEYESYHPFPDVHLSVDDEDDFKLVERVFDSLLPEKELFSLEDVLEVLKSRPEWVAEHPQTPINEGYFKSLFDDQNRPKPLLRQIPLICSERLVHRAYKIIPSCTKILGKGYAQPSPTDSPVCFDRGKNGVIYDVDGNKFIDYSLEMGAVTLGYCYPEVDEAVIAQIHNGVSDSFSHSFEIELAERLCKIIPCAEMVRFGGDTSDATSGAVRIARSVTGREKIVCCDYHGRHDCFMGVSLPNREDTRSKQKLELQCPYNDIKSLEKIFEEHYNKIAAIVMEPVRTIMPDNEYLVLVRDLAHRHNALLIFDETLTGFRLSLGGAQNFFNVVPDLACYGSGLANGYPISAIAGKSDIFEELDQGFSLLTLRGGAMSFAASLATLTAMEREKTTSHMWIMGRKLKEGFNYLSRKYELKNNTWCEGLAPMACVSFKDHMGNDSILYKSIFRQECMKRGVLFDGNHFQCLMRTDYQIEYTITVYDEAFKVLRDVIDGDEE